MFSWITNQSPSDVAIIKGIHWLCVCPKTFKDLGVLDDWNPEGQNFESICLNAFRVWLNANAHHDGWSLNSDHVKAWIEGRYIPLSGPWPLCHLAGHISTFFIVESAVSYSKLAKNANELSRWDGGSIQVGAVFPSEKNCVIYIMCLVVVTDVRQW